MIKKLELPTPETLSKTIKENRFIGMIHEVVDHAFTNNTYVTNPFQNDMIKVLMEEANAKFVGPCYQQQVASISGSINSVQVDIGDQSTKQVAFKLYCQQVPLFSPHQCR